MKKPYIKPTTEAFDLGKEYLTTVGVSGQYITDKDGKQFDLSLSESELENYEEGGE